MFRKTDAGTTRNFLKDTKTKEYISRIFVGSKIILHIHMFACNEGSLNKYKKGTLLHLNTNELKFKERHANQRFKFRTYSAPNYLRPKDLQQICRSNGPYFAKNNGLNDGLTCNNNLQPLMMTKKRGILVQGRTHEKLILK